MKRPRILYFVAAWCCLGLLIQASFLSRPGRAYQAAGEDVPMFLAILPVLAFGFMVWQTIGLVQLKRFHRWFAVVFFSWWTVAVVWNSIFMLGRLSVFLSVIAVFNVSSVWYLSRRTFREFAVQFAAERAKEKHSRMMREASQKRILDDVRS
jgi:hypothetical protein